MKKVIKKQITARRQIDMLKKNREIKNTFVLETTNRYEILSMGDENEDAQQQWNNLQKATEKSTEKIPVMKKKKKQAWMTEDIFEIMDKRRKVKSKDEEKYREYNTQIHRECRKAKEKWMNDRCIEIEGLAKVNQGQMYDKINQILYR